MRNILFLAASSLALAACGMSGQDNEADADVEQTASTGEDMGYDTYSDDNQADTMASNDEPFTRDTQDVEQGSNLGADEADANDADIDDSEERPVMQAQVVLDRVGFGPGVIDGKMGMSTENALRGFQRANDLSESGKLDDATKEALAEWERIPATRVVTIPERWSEISYTDMPEETAAKAELESMGYKSIDEKLAERFHTTVATLRELNPNGRPAGMSDDASGNEADSSGESDTSTTGEADGSYFRPGQQIRVPNIGGDRIEPGAITDRGWQQTLAALGIGTDQPEVDRIVVSKSGGTLEAYQGEELVALFTVTSGSSQFPLPIGNWDIVGKAFNPPYSYDPEVLSGGKEDGETFTLPPGPNSPVGVIWIDLSKEHYGIHGTPEPETIGRAESSGCVRLTNWDAARLAQMVSTETKVEFVA